MRKVIRSVEHRKSMIKVVETYGSQQVLGGRVHDVDFRLLIDGRDITDMLPLTGEGLDVWVERAKRLIDRSTNNP